MAAHSQPGSLDMTKNAHKLATPTNRQLNELNQPITIMLAA